MRTTCRRPNTNSMISIYAKLQGNIIIIVFNREQPVIIGCCVFGFQTDQGAKREECLYDIIFYRNLLHTIRDAVMSH